MSVFRAKTRRTIRWFWGWWQARTVTGVPNSSCTMTCDPVDQFWKYEVIDQKYFSPVTRQIYTCTELGVESIA